MLGLGDIVLPGLLLVWAARLDLRRHGSLTSDEAGKGYFAMALAGYALGLMLANFAVQYFQTGTLVADSLIQLALVTCPYTTFHHGTNR